MEQAIRYVHHVSDGILVGFVDGSQCYYSASFLRGQAGSGSNQMFLDHDPTPRVLPEFKDARYAGPLYSGDGTPRISLD